LDKGKIDGRFPQVSNMRIVADRSLAKGSRVLSIKVGNELLQDNKANKVVTKLLVC
jgi:5'-nucleotidase, C-terminal domain